MKPSNVRIAITTMVIIVALAFIVRQFTQQSISGGAAVGRLFLITGALTKLIALGVAALFAWRVAAGVAREGSARTGWLLLACGLTALAIGQALLTWYQVVRNISPFPSVADIAFVLGYPLLIGSMIAFLRAYAASGFPMQNLPILAVIASIAAIVIAVPLLTPIVRSSGTTLEKALNIAYPALDLILTVPAVLLLRSTSRFRGGAVWKIWAALLAGMLLTAAGDIAFAFLSVLGQTHLDPAVHALYILAYGALAAGVLYQSELMNA
jgi:hypothetical protein